MNRKSLAINIVLPIVLGVLLYALSYYKSLGFVRYYVPDMLWAFALANAVLEILGENKFGIIITLIMTGAFVVIMEGLQKTSFVAGTYDVFDIIVELSAIVVAVILYMTRRKDYKNEE